MKVDVKKASLAYFAAALDDIRREDMAEWFAGTGELFHVGASRAIQDAEVSLVALSEQDGTPLCFWGGSGGRIWLFATEEGKRHALSLHRILRPHLDELRRRWSLLYAIADARNTVHHAWMRRLGFEELPEVPLPPFGLPFRTFLMDSKE